MTKYTYDSFREWAEALDEYSPRGLGEALKKYADAWEVDRRRVEELNETLQRLYSISPPDVRNPLDD